MTSQLKAHILLKLKVSAPSSEGLPSPRSKWWSLVNIKWWVIWIWDTLAIRSFIGCTGVAVKGTTAYHNKECYRYLVKLDSIFSPNFQGFSQNPNIWSCHHQVRCPTVALQILRLHPLLLLYLHHPQQKRSDLAWIWQPGYMFFIDIPWKSIKIYKKHVKNDVSFLMMINQPQKNWWLPACIYLWTLFYIDHYMYKEWFFYTVTKPKFFAWPHKHIEKSKNSWTLQWKGGQTCVAGVFLGPENS